MITPTIHLNGTSADELIEQLDRAQRAVLDATKALAQAAPNGRDYYPQGATAAVQAIGEHRVRLTALAGIRTDLLAILESVLDQQEQRVTARKRAEA